MKLSKLFGAVGTVTLLLTLAACTDNSSGGDASGSGSDDSSAPTAIAVRSTDDACDVEAATAPSGNLVFAVQNDGSQVTEFYLLAADGKRIVGEVENVGPGISRKLVVQAAPGEYLTACKPGMVGDGIRADFAVSDSGADLNPSGDIGELVDTATAQYAAYARQQAEQLLAGTTEFVAEYKAGNDDAARALYAPTRAHWEAIEPVAESFGDLDPSMDLREADLEEGQEWTGWHRIEKDLWPQDAGAAYVPLTQTERDTLADQLLTDTQSLYDQTRDVTFTADQIGNGAKGLLDEVASSKVTGEEETWSHTDLWDFQANVDGARVSFEDLQPALQSKDPELAEELTAQFESIQALLDQYKQGDGFVLYTTLSPAQVKELSDSVNSLSEPLSQLTAAVVL